MESKTASILNMPNSATQVIIDFESLTLKII